MDRTTGVALLCILNDWSREGLRHSRTRFPSLKQQQRRHKQNPGRWFRPVDTSRRQSCIRLFKKLLYVTTIRNSISPPVYLSIQQCSAPQEHCRKIDRQVELLLYSCGPALHRERWILG